MGTQRGTVLYQIHKEALNMTLYHVETFAIDTNTGKRKFLAHQFIIDADSIDALRSKLARHMCPNVVADIYVPSKSKGHTIVVRLGGTMYLDKKLQMWRWKGYDIKGNATTNGIVQQNGSIRKD